MSNFDKTLLGKNIKFLATQKGIKVGDIETEAGVSTGYLSRLANEDNKKNFPIMDLIFLISNKLDVSVNTLLSVDLSNLTPNEILLSQFFDKLSKDTQNNKLIWELESKSKLEECKQQGNHPLFFPVHPGDFGTEFYYHSTFDSEAVIAGDCYKVIVGNKWLYLMCVSKEYDYINGYELYFISSNYQGYPNIEQICKAYSESDLYNQIVDLRNQAAESSRHVKLSDSVRSSINEYLTEGDIDSF
ncbi:MAG: helix-turn-helix transcriptional regulator [Treponema sp.]|nr:helix-turn-helix transcriptional regulator [Treponema sp.]